MGVPAAEVPKDVYTSQQIAFNSAVESRIAANDGALDRQLARRQALVDAWSWAVPAVLAAEAMTDLAGTGWRRHRAFLQQGRDYVSALRAYFDPRALRGEFVFREWDAWPRFVWHEPTRRPALVRAAAASAGLLGMAMALSLWARRRLERVSPDGRTS
jgi:ABC-2 type transport system permease protein